MEACKLPQEVATGFSAVNHLIGAAYIPLLYCGKQLVNGWNHMLICKQTLSTREPVDHVVEMVLHQDVTEDNRPGQFRILSIKTVI